MTERGKLRAFWGGLERGVRGGLRAGVWSVAMVAGVLGAAEGGESVEALWKGVLALDAGPAQGPRSVGEAKEVFAKHAYRQEQALRRFLEVVEPSEARRFEARLRLARVLTIRAELESKPEWQTESNQILDELDAGGTRSQKAEVAFTRLSQWMRRNRFPNREQRQELLAGVREFRENYPSDRRLASLLVEVATRFERDPRVKEELLTAAGKATQDAGLRQRIADDFARMELLGKTLPLRFTDLNGRHFRLEDYRGKSAVVLYYASHAPPSLAAWRRLNEVLVKYPGVLRIGVCLDEDRVQMERTRQVLGERWVTAWDGRGWQSSFARRWGVNALPTAWLLDAKGVVVSLNVLEDTEEQLDALEGSLRGGK